MNTTFNTGDRVELVENYYHHASTGDQGTITRGTYRNPGSTRGLTEIKLDSGVTKGIYTSRLKLVEAKAHEYKEGDRVQITIPEGDTSSFGGGFFVTSAGTVKAIESECIKVLADTPHPQRQHKDWWVYRKFVTPLAETPFKVGDLVEILDNNGWGDASRQPGRRHKVAMVDETQIHLDTLGDNDLYYYKFSQVKKVVEVRKPEIGDVIISKRTWGTRVGVGTRCVVTRIGHEGALSARVQGSTDTFAWFFDKGQYELAPLAEKPKATPATDTKPRIGDTLVAFWNDGGVETRKKGVIASFDGDGTACTVDGGYITYDTHGEEAAEDSVFIVERGPEPEAVKPNPRQKYINAPLGSIVSSPHSGHQWSKTGEDEWTFFNLDRTSTFRDRTNANVGDGEDSILVTF